MSKAKSDQWRKSNSEYKKEKALEHNELYEYMKKKGGEKEIIPATAGRTGASNPPRK